MFRMFEYVYGTSNKFWSIETDQSDACKVTVRFGRRGTAGNINTKVFPTIAKADQFIIRMIQEKLGKGYVEVQNPVPFPGAKRKVTVVPVGEELAMSDANRAAEAVQNFAAQTGKKVPGWIKEEPWLAANSPAPKRRTRTSQSPPKTPGTKPLVTPSSKKPSTAPGVKPKRRVVI